MYKNIPVKTNSIPVLLNNVSEYTSAFEIKF